MPTKNAKEVNVAHTDANSTEPTDHAVSDLQEPPKLASRKDDATDWESADQLLSNKTQPRNASNLMEPRDSVTSSLEFAHKLFLLSFSTQFSPLSLPPSFFFLSCRVPVIRFKYINLPKQIYE